MGMESGALTEVIDAPASEVMAVLLDFESYPQWQSVFAESTVLERDAEGLPALVEYCVDVKISKVRYVARYSYDLPRGFAWRLVRGDLKQNAGRYTITPRPDGRTEVSVAIRFEVGFYVPGPIKNAIRDQSLRVSMRELRQRVER